MKKIVASVGLVALGASAIQTASAQALVGPDASKPWSVGLTLRGFYDDNPGTIPNDQPVVNGYKRDSYGWEVTPSAALAWSLDQTTFNLGLLYSLKYYQERPPYSLDHDDQTFTFNAGLTHAFNERFKARVSDSFVIGQEPDLLRAGNVFSTFQRVSGDNIRNFGTIALDGQLTPKFGVGLGYDNAFYDYKNTGFTLVPTGNPFFDSVQPSTAGMLNRIENRAHIEGLYQLQPETKGLLGYQFTDISYTADEVVGGFSFLGGPVFNQVMSDERNSREHTMYVGLEHNFSPEFSGAIRAGGSYTEYYKNPNGSDSNWTPYVNASLKYTYAPESFVQGGFAYDRNASDVVGLIGSSGSFVLDAESAVVFASVKHRITPKLFGSVLGQFQNSSLNGGQFDNQNEQYYLAGIDVEYRFNQYFSGHVGYNYDRLESDLGRTFDRNRVYIGVTASY